MGAAPGKCTAGDVMHFRRMAGCSVFLPQYLFGVLSAQHCLRLAGRRVLLSLPWDTIFLSALCPPCGTGGIIYQPTGRVTPAWSGFESVMLRALGRLHLTSQACVARPSKVPAEARTLCVWKGPRNTPVQGHMPPGHCIGLSRAVKC